MVSSLVLTDRFSIGVDKNEKYMLNGEKTSIKDIPFIRYRFDSYTPEDTQYINDMKVKFKYSTHLAEFTLGANTKDEIELVLGEVDYIATFIYVPITDEEVEKGLSEETKEQLLAIKNTDYDRVMLKDNSRTLHLVSANNIKKEMANTLKIAEKEIGICSSPLSFDGGACLTAIKARELIAEYSQSEECVIPSANHECMNTCGCIRYKLVTEDIPAPVSTSGSKKTSNKNSGKGKSTLQKKKVSKAPKEWV